MKKNLAFIWSVIIFNLTYSQVTKGNWETFGMNLNSVEEFKSPIIENLHIKSVSAIVYTNWTTPNPTGKGRNVYTLYFNEFGQPVSFMSKGKLGGNYYSNDGKLEYYDNNKIKKASYTSYRNNKPTYTIQFSTEYDNMGRIIQRNTYSISYRSTKTKRFKNGIRWGSKNDTTSEKMFLLYSDSITVKTVIKDSYSSSSQTKHNIDTVVWNSEVKFILDSETFPIYVKYQYDSLDRINEIKVYDPLTCYQYGAYGYQDSLLQFKRILNYDQFGRNIKTMDYDKTQKLIRSMEALYDEKGLLNQKIFREDKYVVLYKFEFF